MENLLVLRGRLQEFYAQKSKIIDRVSQFILAFATFMLISKEIGFMKAASSPVVALGLALVCAFLPMILTVIAAAALMMLQAYTLSLGVVLVVGVTFLIMFIFYFRLTPKKAFILLLMPLAFALKIPYVIPAAFALLGAPISLVAITSGTIVYYMMECMKQTANVAKGAGAKGMMGQLTLFAKQVFQNKAMWIVILALIISFFVVYTIRKQSIDHAWKIAIVAGAVMNIIVVSAGDIAFGIHTSYVSLILGNILAIVVGLLLEILFFSVDYARSESLQFEDDEYCYYVKAVPKISVSSPEKTVKRINERQETEIIDTEEVRKRAGRTRGQLSTKNAAVSKQPRKPKQTPKRGPETREQIISNTEQILLQKSLERDLGLHNKQ